MSRVESENEFSRFRESIVYFLFTSRDSAVLAKMQMYFRERMSSIISDSTSHHKSRIARARITKICPKARRSRCSSRHHTHATCERAAEQITISPLTERIHVIRNTAPLFRIRQERSKVLDSI